MNGARFWISAGILAVCAAILLTRPAVDHNPERLMLAELPTQIDNMSSIDFPIDQETRDVLGNGDFLSRVYRGTTPTADKPRPHEIGLFIGYFPSQRTGSTIHSPKNCLPGAGWTFDSQEYTILTDDAGKAHKVGEYLISNGNQRQYVIYWYEAHGRSVANEYAAKLHLVLDAMRMNRTDGALVRVMSPVGLHEDVSAGRERAERFAKILSPMLPKYIPN